jgi:hypothetical protein
MKYRRLGGYLRMREGGVDPYDAVEHLARQEGITANAMTQYLRGKCVPVPFPSERNFGHPTYDLERVREEFAKLSPPPPCPAVPEVLEVDHSVIPYDEDSLARKVAEHVMGLAWSRLVDLAYDQGRAAGRLEVHGPRLLDASS